jgi:hypothetical protein
MLSIAKPLIWYSLSKEHLHACVVHMVYRTAADLVKVVLNAAVGMVHEAYSTAAGLVLKRSIRRSAWVQSTAAGMQVVLFILHVRYCMHSAHMFRCTAVFIQLYYHVPLP